MKFLLEKSFQLFLTIIMIVFLLAFSNMLFAPKEEMLSTFYDVLKSIMGSFIYFNEVIPIEEPTGFNPLIYALLEPFKYSLTILFSSLLFAFIVGMTFAYFAYLLPSKTRQYMKEFLSFIQSIPDVIFVFGMQLFLIWIYTKTGILIFKPIAGFDDVYALPIIVVSVLPAIMLFQMAMLAIEEECEKDYVEFAKSKGLSKSWIFFKHILRNVLVTIFSNVQLVFWTLISNLLVVEILFNIQGLFYFLKEQLFNPEAFAVSITVLLLPFYFFDVVIKIIVYKLTGREQF